MLPLVTFLLSGEVDSLDDETSLLAFVLLAHSCRLLALGIIVNVIVVVLLQMSRLKMNSYSWLAVGSINIEHLKEFEV